jgi:hypothetical protein
VDARERRVERLRTPGEASVDGGETAHGGEADTGRPRESSKVHTTSQGRD